jgi:hypothetical protein
MTQGVLKNDARAMDLGRAIPYIFTQEMQNP